MPDGGLHQRLIAEHRLHGPRCFGAGQFEKCGETGTSQSQSYRGIARGEQ